MSLFDIPTVYQSRFPNDRLRHWTRVRGMLSCDACIMDRHNHSVTQPIERAMWRMDTRNKVLHLCRAHAHEAWRA